MWFGALQHAAHDLWASCVFFTATLGVLCVSAWLNTQSSRAFYFPAGLPIALFLTTLILSFPRAYDKGTFLLNVWGWLFIFILTFIFINTIEDERDKDLVLRPAALVVVPLALICLWQQFTSQPDSWGHWEIHGTLINSMVLGGFALNVLFLFFEKAMLKDRYAQLIVLCCGVLLLLARSSWSYICLLAGFAVHYRSQISTWHSRYRKETHMAIALLVLALLGIVIWKITNHVGPYKGSSRLFYWQVAFKIWAQSPWTGVGLGGYATAYPYFRQHLFQSTLFAHGFLLQWACETGLLGILALGILGVAFFKACKRPHPYLAGLCATLLYSLISINLEYLLNKYLLLLTLVAGLAGSSRTAVRIKPLWINLFSLSIFLLSPFWLRMFFGSQHWVQGMSYEAAGQTNAAIKAYVTTVELDPYLSESYAALSTMAWAAYTSGNHTSGRNEAISYIQKALECKKDIRYQQLLNTYLTDDASPPGRMSK